MGDHTTGATRQIPPAHQPLPLLHEKMNSLNAETFLVKSSHQSYKLGRKQRVKEASQHYRPGIELANDLSTSLTEI